MNSGGTLRLAAHGQINDSITSLTITGGTFDLQGYIEGVTPVTTLADGTITGTSAGFLLSRGGFAGSGTNTISERISVRGGDANSGRFDISSGTTTVSGVIFSDDSSVQGITKTGAGTLTLSGASTYRAARPWRGGRSWSTATTGRRPAR